MLNHNSYVPVVCAVNGVVVVIIDVAASVAEIAGDLLLRPPSIG